jgi:antitoxin component HigA of HigAB toxin-antitoxin module
MKWSEWKRNKIRALLWIMDARSARIERQLQSLIVMVQQLTGMERIEMTTIQDVRAEIDAMREEAAHNAQIDQAASAAIRRLVDMMANAAASATDLQQLQSDIAAIRGQVHDSADGLGQAIAEVPTT